MKLISRTLAIILVMLWYGSKAQNPTIDNDIMKTSKIGEGIYKTFDEFRRNSPSIQNVDVVLVNKDKRFNFYKFSFSNVNTRDFKEEIWGFSKDGVIFISAKKFKGGSKLFTPVEIGRYCYFSNDNLVKYNADASVPKVILVQEMASEHYLININNGEIFPLTKETITAI